MADLYDRIGGGYATTRVADARIASLIDDALGAAVEVINVGAGTGNYEPIGRRVVAVEPSEAMIAQRRPDAAVTAGPTPRRCRSLTGVSMPRWRCGQCTTGQTGGQGWARCVA